MTSVVALLVSSLLELTAPGASSCLTPPVTTVITARFDAPSCPYCAGHRTLDFSTTTGTNVVAPIAGTVTFAGVVAGSPYITVSVSSRSRNGPGEFIDIEAGIESDESWGSTYLVTIGGVNADPGVTAGSLVDVGRRIGTASGERVRLSLRRTVPGGEAVYLDPESSLLRWRAPARLVPPPGRAAGRVVTRIWACRTPL
ncbi:MAG: hypothetical protein ACKOI2_11270 [Actinomycetota bacterium]